MLQVYYAYWSNTLCTIDCISSRGEQCILTRDEVCRVRMHSLLTEWGYVRNDTHLCLLYFYSNYWIICTILITGLIQLYLALDSGIACETHLSPVRRRHPARETSRCWLEFTLPPVHRHLFVSSKWPVNTYGIKTLFKYVLTYRIINKVIGNKHHIHLYRSTQHILNFALNSDTYRYGLQTVSFSTQQRKAPLIVICFWGKAM